MNRASINFESQELEQLINALGSNAQVAYAPPNIYPMSAPSFRSNSEAERERPESDELGLYAHIPFCNYTCTFCFYAKQLPREQDELQQYVNALKKELTWVKPGTRLTQLYVGGGTPSILPAPLLDELLSAIFERMRPRGQDVHTVECSPDSVTAEHVKVLQHHGIKRVSMGVQSLQKQVLDTVNRHHEVDQVLAACDLLVSAGLMLNVDLIYGLPGQTEKSFAQDFETLAEKGIHSVTTYNLRVNENTPIGRALSAEERLNLQRLMHWRVFVRATAEQWGFEQTRWHTFRRLNPSTAADATSRFADITGQGNQFGIGVSARSRLNHRVYRNHGKNDTYLQRIACGASPVEETMDLSESERKIRFLALSLGDGKALNRQAYWEQFGCSFDEDFAEPLQRLQNVALIVDDREQIKLTEQGKLLYDLVMRAFYPRQLQQWLEERTELALASPNLHPRQSL